MSTMYVTYLQRFVFLIAGKWPRWHNRPKPFRIKYDILPRGEPCILAVGNQTAELVGIGFQQSVWYVVRTNDLHDLFQSRHDVERTRRATKHTLALEMVFKTRWYDASGLDDKSRKRTLYERRQHIGVQYSIAFYRGCRGESMIFENGQRCLNFFWNVKWTTLVPLSNNGAEWIRIYDSPLTIGRERACRASIIGPPPPPTPSPPDHDV